MSMQEEADMGYWILIAVFLAGMLVGWLLRGAF